MQIRVAGGDAIFRCSGVALRFMGDGGKSLPTRAREPHLVLLHAGAAGETPPRLRTGGWCMTGATQAPAADAQRADASPSNRDTRRGFRGIGKFPSRRLNLTDARADFGHRERPDRSIVNTLIGTS